jgi:SlyX protein
VTDDIQRLEEKIAYLEHHVTEQDKVMLELTEELTRLRREVLRLAERVEAAAPRGGSAGSELPDERPPHY